MKKKSLSEKSEQTKKSNSKASKKDGLQSQLLQFFENHRGELFKTNEISKMVGIKSDSPQYQDLRSALNKLEADGEILRGSRRRYGLPRPEQSIIVGILKMQTTGNAVVMPDEEFAVGDTVLIRARNLHAACQGDRVRVAIYAERKNERPQGEVLEILDRAFAPVVGRVKRTRNSFVVRPETGKFTRDIVIGKRELGGAKEGDKVKVQLYEWVDEFREPEGKVLEVLGTSGSVKAEMEAIAAEYDLPTEFPPDVMKEALALPDKISAAEIKKRLDLRKETIFTIDPEDAKDFDDAVSLTHNDDGTVLLGVHIADVSHYVTEDSKLDEEALARGTSVYLVGGVIPMLPERISNELCSLRPDEDKLTFSALLTIDPESGKVTKSQFKRTIIRSAMRFSYEEAEKRIVTGKGAHAELLREMRTLSEKMYALRHAEGSIDFETDEVRFKFDAEGNPIESYKKERLGSMKMIEDFMLAANRAVAESIGKKAKHGVAPPFLYRIHADPDPAKIRDLAALAKSLGYKLQTENPRPKTVQKFLDSIKGRPEEKLLNQLMLRAMAKAIYAEHNVGHFGLAFLHYTHFTSPIRRYPDLVVHRILAEYQKRGGMTQERERHFFQILPSIADQTSGLERRATEAERESIKVAQMLLMKDHLGEEFEGIISGVTHFGLFVQLPSGAEGLLHIRELQGHYIFDEAHYSLTRQRGGRGFQQKRRKRDAAAERYRIGDQIRVQLVRIREERRELDFKLAELS